MKRYHEVWNGCRPVSIAEKGIPKSLFLLQDEEMNKLSSEEGGGFHEEVLQKYTGGHLADPLAVDSAQT